MALTFRLELNEHQGITLFIILFLLGNESLISKCGPQFEYYDKRELTGLESKWNLIYKSITYIFC